MSHLVASLRPESGTSRPLPMMLSIITCNRGEPVEFFSLIYDLTLVCFFMATSNLLLASIDILALSL